MKTLRIVFLCFVLSIICFLLAGCAALVPKEQHQSQSVQATEAIATESERTTRRTMSVVPEMVRSIHQSNGVASFAITETTEDTARISTGAGSRSDARGSSTVSIPLFVKIIGLAVAIGALAGVLMWLWRSAKTTAIGQGLQAADQLAAGWIRRKRTQATLATDREEINRLNAEIAEMEADRGRLKK